MSAPGVVWNERNACHSCGGTAGTSPYRNGRVTRSGARAQSGKNPLGQDWSVGVLSPTMLWPVLERWIVAGLLCLVASAQYSSDQCSWRGSGLTHESHSRDVEQVYLRCSQGSLEWLYPTGALIISLRPNTEPSSGASHGLHACIKPQADSRGAHLYLERAGRLHLLMAEKEQTEGRVRCFPLRNGSLFVEAVGQQDISRRIAAFQYQLMTGAGAHLYPQPNTFNPQINTDPCTQCSDDQVLMAVCTSDFVGRGSVYATDAPHSSDNFSIAVTLSRLFRQKSRVFSLGGARGRGWSGRLNTPPQCRTLPEEEEFLFTGAVRFGEAWLGCATHYRHFLELYRTALETGSNPCHIDTD
ncbi:meteorin-like protein isoform X2 [Esox lucius]|uniref:meteorin-like protein isoform X2 n=1 Tax=Esox lucius TaxID=8010 RepID=UPI00097331FE|nr:meteorin-like protein isoform X2 [Esox lucius]